MSDSPNDIVNVTDGYHVEYQRQTPRAYYMLDRKGREVVLSAEFVTVQFGDMGRRVFSGERWYFDKIGLDYGI